MIFSSTERSSSVRVPFSSRFAFLSELLRGLAHDAVEAVGEVAERHEAHAHQALLQLAVEARLRVDRELGLVEVLLQRPGAA